MRPSTPHLMVAQDLNYLTIIGTRIVMDLLMTAFRQKVQWEISFEELFTTRQKDFAINSRGMFVPFLKTLATCRNA